MVMAVQAQQLPMDFHPIPRIRINVLEQQQQQQFGNGTTTTPYGGHGGDFEGAGAVPAQIFNGNTVFSEPRSELTCNVSGSRKRPREEPMQQQQLPSLQAAVGVHDLIRLYQQQQGTVQFNPVMVKTFLPEHPAGVQATSAEDSRLIHSAMTSTSGRPPAAASPAPLPVFSPLVHDMVSLFNIQNAEIDTLIRLHNAQLRDGLEQASKRHCRAMVSAFGQHAQRRLKEKQAELDTVNRRNAELEERAGQVAAESQIWFNIAKNNEAMAATLRSSLEQALLQTINHCTGGGNEGYGDTNGGAGAAAAAADDALSCCFDGEQGGRIHPLATAVAVNKTVGKKGCCKGCGEREVSVLVLPCRHLCLCKDCDAEADTCPVCHTTKSASLQVLLS